MRLALLVPGFALLLVPGLALAQAGRFLLSAGEAVVVRGSQEIRASAGTTVEAGDTIRIGPRSNAQIRMSDGSILALRSGTVFRIDEYVHSGGEGDRSVFSLVKGGLRTVTGAIARAPATPVVRTSAAAAPVEQKKSEQPREESKLLGLVRAPLRAMTGAITRTDTTRHAVRTPTGLIGVRGTHYTVVHCDNDCVVPRRTSVASVGLAQSDAAAPGVGELAPNGTYTGTSDGLIGFVNDAVDQEFGPQEFFYVASMQSPPQRLIGPPAFLYDRLEGQERARGQSSSESTETLARSGLNAESRPGEPPVPPAPEPFIVTEQRNSTGDPAVLAGSAAPSLAFLGAYANASGGIGTPGAFVSSAELIVSGADISRTLEGFNIAAGLNASGAISGTAAVDSVLNETAPNPLDAYWGRWIGGTITDANGTTSISSLNQFHYLVAPQTPPDVIAAKTGSFPFSAVQGTTPTNNLGEIGSFSMSGLTVNFTARTVSSSGATFSFQSQTWNFGSSSTSIQFAPSGAYISTAAAGSCSNGACATFTPAVLNMTGVFLGAGDHLGMALQARTISAPDASAQTVQIFTCSPRC